MKSSCYLNKIATLAMSTFLLFIASCNEKSFDRKTLLSLGEYVFYALSKSDTSMIWSIYDLKNESIYEKAFREANDVKVLNDFIKIDNKIKLLQIDTLRLSEYKLLEILIQKNNEIYVVDCGYYLDSFGQFGLSSIGISNYSNLCNEYLESPYIPVSGLTFKKLLWNMNRQKNTFLDGQIELENTSEFPIEFLTFRLKIFKYSNIFNQDIIFNQTIESNQNILNGDLVRINIPQLDSYYFGESLGEGKIGFDVDVLSVLPKPESYYCKIVNDLNLGKLK
jgi:hypothetical protein